MMTVQNMIESHAETIKTHQISTNQKKSDHSEQFKECSIKQANFTPEQIQEIKNRQILIAIKAWNRLKASSAGWESVYGKALEKNETWLNLLLVKTPEQIQRGLYHTVMTPNNYPVTTSMFNYFAVMGDVPKKFEILDGLHQNSNYCKCKYTYWIRKNISSRFFQTTNESIEIAMLDEALQKLYNYMNVNIDVPEIPDNENQKQKAEITEEERKKTAIQLRVLNDYLQNLDDIGR